MSEDIKFKLGLDGTAFKRGVTSAKADLKRFTAETAQSWRQAFSVGAAVAGLKVLGDKMLELRRSAEDLGVSTDFLQSIGRMAVKFGGQSEDANNALIKLAETIGQARTEGGAAEEKFTRFGVSLYDINGQAKTTEEIFKDIANRYRGASDAATKAALAFEFFGKTGRNINNILGEGADGIDSYTAQMQKFWLIASPENVNALADAWSRLKTNVSGFAANVLGSAASGLEFSFGLLGALSSGANVRDALNAATEAAGFSGRQNAERATQEADQKERLVKEAQKLSEIEEKIAKTGKEALIETDEQRLAFLKDEVQAARDAMQAETDRVKRAEKRLELEKAQVKVQEQQKKIAADAAALQMERMDRMGALLEQRKTAQETIADRTRFSMEELAGANLRGVSDPALRSDILKARQVRELTGRAEQLRLSGRAGSLQQAAELFTKADQIRQGITSLRSEDRLTSMDRNIAEVNEGIKAFNNLASETGFIVRPLMSK